MHKLLQRQTRRFLGDRVSEIPQEFLEAVDLAYRQADEDRDLLERAMDLTSDELMVRNEELRLEMKEHERALAVLEATLDATEEGIMVIDSRQRIMSSNLQFLQIFGQTPEELLLSDRGLDRAASATADPEAFKARISEIYADPEGESFDILHLLDGRVIERTSAPLSIQGGIAGRVWSFRDTTARHEMEQRERQAQKMEAVGRLAGGVAHDFNNLLTVIQGFCDLAAGRLAKGDAESVAEHLSQILGAAERAAQLTGQLLALSRQQVLQTRPIDLGRRVQELRPVFERALGSMIDLRIEIGDGPMAVLMDPGSLEQVLLNLVLNARDAMPDGGRLQLRLERCPGEECDWIDLQVTDTGCGIEPEILERIFEPFFTSKELGKGTGLGLAAVHGIVTQSGGTIEVRSEVGEGAHFRMRFPATTGSIEAPPRRVSTPLPDPPAVRVLVVDDDTTVRLILVESLRYLGFTVFEAVDPADCLRRHHDLDFDLLLTDIVMPGMSGFELSRRLTNNRPRLRVLYVSGYDPDARNRLGQPMADGAFLSKPFNTETLARKVREVLEAEPLRPRAAESVVGG